jgi:RimJ/RimL family protein N-acetyltransferase
MLKLETERLILVPLSLENFKLYLENRRKLEENLEVVVTGEKTSPEKKKIFQEPYEKAKKDSTNHLWYTHWQVILKKENRFVCGITFKGIPNDAGEVEIGYGTREGYKNKGYMTETVSRLIKWTFEQEEVNSVLAETNKDNKASQKVLEKSGLRKFRDTDKRYWYRIDKSMG